MGPKIKLTPASGINLNNDDRNRKIQKCCGQQDEFNGK
jgi:hypothetical protein